MTVLLIFINFYAALFGGFSDADDHAAQIYLNKYKDIAVIEMYRTGVPASIKLAQGMHESSFGRSRLATNANNHFGIKCKTYWKGSTYYHKDDDFKNGKLIKSCFRSYNSELESFVDHSNFLSQRRHYKQLFDLERTDYVAWAKGLKSSGYATDKRYAEKLISIIERYNLNVFDYSKNPLN